MKQEITNGKIASVLHKIADLLEIEGESPFKSSAYRKAAIAFESFTESINEQTNLMGIEGIGKSTSSVIQELIEKGESSYLKELQRKIPGDLLQLLRIPGLGPKSIGRLYRELGIDTFEKLEEAGKRQRIRALSGFGAKTELKIIKGLKQMKEKPERIPIAVAYPIAMELKQRIENISGVERVVITGSLRRYRETIKDIDFLISTDHAEHISRRILDLPAISEVVFDEPTHLMFVMEYLWPIRVDIRIVSPPAFAHALQLYTGSEEHNRKLQQRADEKGLRFTELGITSEKNEPQLERYASEEEIYNRLNISYIPPEIREGSGEINCAEKGILPRLIHLEDMQGDLHMHTDWSDGGNSIEEMARAAYLRGYRYIAITDHSRSLKIARGLSIERLLEQKEKIKQIEKRLREEWPDFTILCGVEMDILANGQLDYPEEVLQEMDLVIGSIHSVFRQDEVKMTKRIIGAILNKHVDFIAHPTGRLIGQRDPYLVNIDVLLKAAKESGTALELNANPNRLDLKPEYLQRAVEDGVLIAINTDAHAVDELANMEIGIGSARRGWVGPENVINTWTIDKLQSYLKRKDGK